MMPKIVSLFHAYFRLIKSLGVLFKKSEKSKFLLIIFAQVGLGVLDLVGVAVIGLVGTVALNGVQGRPLGTVVTKSFEFFGLSEWTLQTKVSLLGSLAVLVLVLRTTISIFFQRHLLMYLSRKGAGLAEFITSRLMEQPLLKLHKLGFQLPAFAITTGTSILTVSVVGGLASFVSDLVLILILLGGMTFFNPLLATQALIFYVSLAFVLYVSVQKRVRELGSTESSINVEVNRKVYESLTMYRELYVHRRRNEYASKITMLRNSLSEIQAESALIPSVSKYVFESAVVIGSLFLCAIQFLAYDAIQAMTSLIFFLAVSSRIAPAVLRLHQNALQVKSGLGSGATTLEVLTHLGFNDSQEIRISTKPFTPKIFSARVELNGVSFAHEGNEKWSLEDISFEIEEGEFFAIVGPSAAGKTTLVDVILGLIEPSAGTVMIGGFPPHLAIQSWPNAISYVPQDVNLIEGAILDNIALGYTSAEIDMENVKRAIKISNLEHFIESLPDGVFSKVQERGVNLSGGLRQRVGIARALFTNPKLVVFDEATSALDSETERVVTEAIRNLRGSRTIILIAHRLSTLLEADRVLYLSDGKVKALGTFSEVRAALPEFDHQARLMGL